MARAIRPGQFLMIRPGRAGTDPLLGRPFALYDVARDARGRPGARRRVPRRGARDGRAGRVPAGRPRLGRGPLGNGFGPPPSGPVLFVAGGIGQTPFLSLGRWWRVGPRMASAGALAGPFASSARLLYGVRTADLAAGLDDFEGRGGGRSGDRRRLGRPSGIRHRPPGSRLDAGERPAKVVGCGPPAMLAALTRLVDRHGVACDLSLENHMACGIGVCFSCVAPIRQPDGSIDLRRVCVEGPVFASSVVA